MVPHKLYYFSNASEYNFIENDNFNPLPNTENYDKYYNLIDKIKLERSFMTDVVIEESGHWAILFDNNYLASEVSVSKFDEQKTKMTNIKSPEIKRICLNVEERKKETYTKYYSDRQIKTAKRNSNFSIAALVLLNIISLFKEQILKLFL